MKDERRLSRENIRTLADDLENRHEQKGRGRGEINENQE